MSRAEIEAEAADHQRGTRALADADRMVEYAKKVAASNGVDAA